MSIFCGVLAAVVSHPFDVIKTRMQADIRGASALYWCVYRRPARSSGRFRSKFTLPLADQPSFLFLFSFFFFLPPPPPPLLPRLSSLTISQLYNGILPRGGRVVGAAVILNECGRFLKPMVNLSD